MNRKTPSTAELIASYSQARVLYASRKRFIVLDGFSREMDDQDAVKSMIRKYAK